jgi:nucleotide-binding universal stress UspA family protein
VKTILVCYEEGPVASRVLERTAFLAKALGAKVFVTSVAPVLHSRGGPIDVVDPPSRHVEETKDAITRLTELGVSETAGIPGLGDPADVAVHLAEEYAVDLIVVGAHEGGFVSRLVSGSVDEAISRKAHADVLIVH